MSIQGNEAAELANRIEAARMAAGLTLRDLSDTSGIAYPTLRRKLQNKPDSFTMFEVAALARALGASFEIGFAA